MTRGKERPSVLDDLIVEYLSFDIYRSGKAPFSDIDAKKRVRSSIWREQGVDLTALAFKGPAVGRTEEDSEILDIEEVTIRVGLFRRKRQHKFLKGLKPLGALQQDVASVSGGPSSDISTRIRALCTSKLVMPLIISLSTRELSGLMGSIPVERSPQYEHMDLSPASAEQRFLELDKGPTGPEDLMVLFGKKFPKDKWAKTRSGIIVKGLPALICTIFDSTDDEVRSIIDSGMPQKFARDVLRSSRLEVLFTDLSMTPEGGMESPEGFRRRLGRYLMGGELAALTHSHVVMPLLDKLERSSAQEAERLEHVIGPLMDRMSVQRLAGILFSDNQGPRRTVIRLLGATGDRSALEPLNRIFSYSSVGTDKQEAYDALSRLGFTPPGSGPAP